MKRYVKLLLLCLVLTLPLCLGVSAGAAGIKTVPLKSGKTYTYDLNGDRKKEKIRVDIKAGSKGPIAQIYINGKCLATRAWEDYDDDTSIYIHLIDVNKKDKYKEIHLVQKTWWQGELLDHAYIYRYNSGKLKLYGTIKYPGVEGTLLKSVQPGDGRIVYTTCQIYEYPEGLWYEAAYKKTGSRMKETSNICNVTSFSKKIKYTARKSFKATASRGSGKTIFTIKPGQKLSAEKVSYYKNKHYIYVKNAKGKKGWIKYSNLGDLNR